MDFNIGHVLTIGVFGILAGCAFLVAVVGRDLAPRSGLSGPRRWLIAGGLGLGVLAFSFKLAAIALVSWLPPRADPARLTPPSSEATGAMASSHSLRRREPPWQPLPDMAPAPADNPTTPEKAALGRRLFFETDLSLDRTLSCASCHDLAHGGADARPTSSGVLGANGKRNAPTVYNAAFQRRLFWDGRARSLEAQALGPLLNPMEMAMPDANAIEARLRDNPAYPPLFAEAFGDETISIARIAQAIAAFERTLITPDSAYDRFAKGDIGALDARQIRGLNRFHEIGCTQCHSGPNFSGASVLTDDGGLRIFPAIENAMLDAYSLRYDKGAAGPGSERGVWRIPSLRNVALTQPYFHNGSVSTLREAVRIMAVTQLNILLVGESYHISMNSPWKGERHPEGEGHMALREDDIADIVAFLESLTSDRLKRAGATP